MGKEKEKKVIGVELIYDKDSKRYKRFSVAGNSYGIVGTIYVAKDKPMPDQIELKIRMEEKEE